MESPGVLNAQQKVEMCVDEVISKIKTTLTNTSR